MYSKLKKIIANKKKDLIKFEARYKLVKDFEILQEFQFVFFLVLNQKEGVNEHYI